MESIVIDGKEYRPVIHQTRAGAKYSTGLYSGRSLKPEYTNMYIVLRKSHANELRLRAYKNNKPLPLIVLDVLDKALLNKDK